MRERKRDWRVAIDVSIFICVVLSWLLVTCVLQPPWRCAYHSRPVSDRPQSLVLSRDLPPFLLSRSRSRHRSAAPRLIEVAMRPAFVRQDCLLVSLCCPFGFGLLVCSE